MELFDKKFVYFMWDDELRGKECFYDDDIAELRQSVNADTAGSRGCLVPSTNTSYPFRPLHAAAYGGWRFAYYDPNYAYKVAYSEGKKIQLRRKGEKDWYESTPAWDPRYEYRIKPVKYYVGIGINKTLTWHSDTIAYKHVYASFDNKQDADKWIAAHKKFVPVMRAFEKGLTIEYKVSCGDWTEASTPSWDLRLRYRVKPIQTKKALHSTCFMTSKKRRMTNRELAKWLAEGKGQARMGNVILTDYRYADADTDEGNVCDCMIRAWNETEWHAPEVEQ